MMRDYERLASLFTEDAAVRMPAHQRRGEQPSRDPRRHRAHAGILQLFVQNTHPGALELKGDTARGRTFISELMYGPRGSHLNHAIYHDRYQRTPDGWKFTERVYEVRYIDTAARGSALSLPRPPDAEPMRRPRPTERAAILPVPRRSSSVG